MPGGAGGARSIVLFAGLAVAAWLASGFYTVGPNEVGLNMIFGRYDAKTTSGLNYNWPSPIGAVQKLQVTDRNSTEVGFRAREDGRRSNVQTQIDVPEESLMLTGDENIADVKFRVIWQIDPVRPEDYAFNVREPRETVRAVSESVMREIVGRTPIQRILTAERKLIEPAAQDLAQKVLNEYKAGVLILQVQLLSVDQDRLRNEAEAYANRVVPEARGDAARIVQEAEAYREQTVNEAKGQASRFTQVYQQYKNAPDVTRERIYLETMERVLGGMNKVIVDQNGGSGVVPYLPLQGLNVPAPQAQPQGGQPR
jgi:membrane protease subunit HflK